MTIPRRLAVPLLVVAPLVAAMPARAESSADTAAALQASIQAWIADLIGPTVDLGTHKVVVAPDGDAYRFELPLAGPVGETGWTVTADPITVVARPADHGAWTIQSFSYPSPLKVEGTVGADKQPLSWGLELAGQDIHGVFDPTLATATSLDATLSGYHSSSHNPTGEQDTSFARYTVHSGWEPAGEGRVNFVSSGRAEGFKATVTVPDKPGPIEVGAEAISGEVRIDGFAFNRLGDAVRTARAMVPAAVAMAATAEADKQASAAAPKPGQPKPGQPNQAGAPPSAARPLTAEDRAGLHGLVVDVSNLLSGAQEEFKVEHLHVDMNGQGVTLEGLSFAAKAAAPGGMLDTSLTLALDGIDTPLVPPGPLHDLLPRHLALTPHVTGVPMDDVVALLLRVIDNPDADKQDVPPPQAEAIRLLAKGPLKVALEGVAIDLGDVGVKGAGSLTIAGATVAEINGSARIEATGLDGLIQRANTVPELMTAAPFLLLVKGLGEQKGDTIAWNITYANGHAMVNGKDLRALMPQQHPPGPPGQRPQGRPRQ